MKNRLKVLRAERDWTQADLAEALAVSRQTVNAIENGKFDPSLPLAFKTARLFNMTIEEIFQDEQVAGPTAGCGPSRIHLSPTSKRNTGSSRTRSG